MWSIVSYIIFYEYYLCNLLKFPERIVHHKFTAGTWRVPLLLKIDESTHTQADMHMHAHTHTYWQSGGREVVRGELLQALRVYKAKVKIVDKSKKFLQQRRQRHQQQQWRKQQRSHWEKCIQCVTPLPHTSSLFVCSDFVGLLLSLQCDQRRRRRRRRLSRPNLNWCSMWKCMWECVCVWAYVCECVCCINFASTFAWLTL